MNFIKQRSILDLKTGEKGTIIGFSDELTGKKLIEIGLLPGNEVTVIRKSPFGGSLYLKIMRHNYAIRTEEAKNVQIAIG